MPRPDRRYDLLRKRVDLFTKMLPGVEAGDVRALHRARVASRRLRELIPVLQLEDETAAKLGRRLRKVTSKLGGVRELDVLLELAGGLHADTHPPRAVERVRAAIDRDRAAARGALVKGGTAGDLRRVADKLREVLESLRSEDARPQRAPAPPRGWTWAVDARAVRRAEKVKGAIEAAGTVYVPERLHAVRIALKKFRYALELAAEAKGRPATSELRALRRGQDLLGQLHDLQMLIARASEVHDGAGEPAVARDLARLVDALETDCRHLHARYVHERGGLLTLCERIAGGSSTRRPDAVRRSA